MPTITRANRGAKAAADMPVSLAVTYEGKTKYVAVAPGMPTEALAKGLQHAFGKELKAAYGSAPYEIFAVTIDAEDEGEELVMLDVLARTPSIMHAAAAGAMQLVVTPDKPKKKRPLDKLYEALAALQLPLFSALLLCLARSFIVRPFLRALYRTGPAYRLGIGTLGFWEGAPLSVICASLTGTNDTRFWEANRKQVSAGLHGATALLPSDSPQPRATAAPRPALLGLSASRSLRRRRRASSSQSRRSRWPPPTTCTARR